MTGPSTPQPTQPSTPQPTQPDRRDRDPVRAVARLVLTIAVRRHRGRGGPWGEAVLAEFDETRGRWQSVRWAAGGLRTAWRERRNRIGQLPRLTRISRRVAMGTALAAVAVGLVSHYALTPEYTADVTMKPTLDVTDRWFLDRVSFQITGIHHGDVVAYRKRFAQVDQIRRVIGMSADRVECRDGRVHRNGSALDEPYLPAGTRTECDPVTVPPGSLYVLGDNRSISTDSRHEGPVAVEAVLGRVLDLW